MAASLLNSLNVFKGEHVAKSVACRMGDEVDLRCSKAADAVQMWGGRVEFRKMKMGVGDAL